MVILGLKIQKKMSEEHPYHVPALFEETMDALALRPDGVYIDATFGGGGHTRGILERIDPEKGGHVYAFDQDMDAIARAHRDEPGLTLIHSNFRYITNFMRYCRVDGVDGVLADLGVSSHHFDDPGRGFSFRADGPLDMRMNRSGELTARRLILDSSRDELIEIFRLYGEVLWPRQLADAIVSARDNGEDFETIESLLSVVRTVVDPWFEKKEFPKIFQALRIVVNNELEALKQLLIGAKRVLNPGGRLVVISYHSLEDRLVKNYMRTGTFNGEARKDFFGKVMAPMVPKGKVVTAGYEELERNPRARSAKLRTAELK